jgi:hypothetical protein
MSEEAAVSVETADATPIEASATESTQESAVVDTPESVVETEVVEPVTTEPAVEVEASEDDEVVVPEEPVVVEEEEELPKFETLDEALKAVKDLREENKRRRLHNKDVDAVFETAEEGFKEGWLELARLLNGTEEEQSEAVSILASYVGSGDTAEVAELAEPLSEDSILAQIDAKFAERQQALAVKEHQAKIAVEVESLGYKSDASPETPEFASHALLWQLVAAQPEGEKSLTKAHEAVQAHEQSIFDRKLAELKNANTGLPARVSGVSEKAKDADESGPVSAHEVMKRAEEKSLQFYAERNSAPRF